MSTLQYNRQKLHYKWALILCIIALIGYTFYFEQERYREGVNIIKNNIPLLIRFILIVCFSVIFLFISRIPIKIFNLLGFFILLPLGWLISIISYLTIGYEGITVTGYIFLIMASAVVFDFTVKKFFLALILILSFHFILLSFYPVKQPDGLTNHIFLLSLSATLALTMNHLVNLIKKNESKVLEEREILLKEIHHRVKNNLQIISSLLDLQSDSIRDEKTKLAVKEGQGRVKSMALIHQLLYQTENISSIDFPKYLKQLMNFLHDTYFKPERNIRFFIHANDIHLDIDTAISLGLITNELVTNALKHAFQNRNEGIIRISMENLASGKICYKISDDGTGLPENFDLEKSESLGLRLVKLLSRQMNAMLKYFVDSGTEFQLIFTENR